MNVDISQSTWLIITLVIHAEILNTFTPPSLAPLVRSKFYLESWDYFKCLQPLQEYKE